MNSVTGIKQKAPEKLPTASPHQGPGGVLCGVLVGRDPICVSSTQNLRLHQKNLSQ